MSESPCQSVVCPVAFFQSQILAYAPLHIRDCLSLVSKDTVFEDIQPIPLHHELRTVPQIFPTFQTWWLLL